MVWGAGWMVLSCGEGAGYNSRAKFCNNLSSIGGNHKVSLRLGSGGGMVLQADLGKCSPCRDVPTGAATPVALVREDLAQTIYSGLGDVPENAQVLFLGLMDASAKPTVQAIELTGGLTCESYDPFK